MIYGLAAVPSEKTLTVEAGARVHFHAESGIVVAENGSMKVMGEASSDPEAMENEVIFEGDRLEPGFSDIPGQWFTIWLTQGSVNNEFHFTTIKNSLVGLRVDASPVNLSNVQIYNSAAYGLLAATGVINGENMVINNSGIASLDIRIGGIYNFRHCTFANYWNNGFRDSPSVSIANYFTDADGNTSTADLLQADFTNCIIYGNERREYSLSKIEDAAFNFKFENCLLRFEDPTGEFGQDPLYNFSNASLYSATKFNLDPFFQDTEKNNFNIEIGNSGAENFGIITTPPVPVDLNGKTRENPSDVGAYEAIEFPED